MSRLMAAKKKQRRCSNCKRLEAKFTSELDKLRAELGQVKDELAKVKKNSTNSSKPPSGDIVNPAAKTVAPTGKSTRRKRGGQPGHQRHQRTPFKPDEIDDTWIYYYDGCPCCGGKLVDTDIPDKILQQVEIQSIPFRTQEHRRPTQQCTRCDKLHCVDWPDDLKKAGLVGPRLPHCGRRHVIGFRFSGRTLCH